MKSLGNEKHIQRGEIWPLDFEVTSSKGHPYMLFKEWPNPYLAITVTAARYTQKGDFRRTWWLDMNNRWVEKENGDFEIIPVKRFIETSPLYVKSFENIADILEDYPRIQLDVESDFDITNYLFFTDSQEDNGLVYKYVDRYEVNDGLVSLIDWLPYNFRIVKQFDTKDWVEQNYLYDIKILTGENIEQYLSRLLVDDLPTSPWSDEMIRTQIERITDRNVRKSVKDIFESGQPLMPNFDTRAILLYPTKIVVSANIQGGF